MTPLDLDAAKARAQEIVRVHAMEGRCGYTWEACGTLVASRDVLALADEVERLRKENESAYERGGRDWRERVAADGRYLPHHSVRWLVVNGRVCRKQHTDFINDPCVFEDFPLASPQPPAPPDPGRESADGDPEGYGDPAPASPSQKEQWTVCSGDGWIDQSANHPCPGCDACRSTSREVPDSGSHVCRDGKPKSYAAFFCSAGCWRTCSKDGCTKTAATNSLLCPEHSETREELVRLRGALIRISFWALPLVWADDLQRFVPYGVQYGSNGERDYFRRVAREALEWPKR